MNDTHSLSPNSGDHIAALRLHDKDVGSSQVQIVRPNRTHHPTDAPSVRPQKRQTHAARADCNDFPAAAN